MNHCIYKMPYNVLELYCGIGGAHFAFQESGIDFEVVAAVDINNHTNAVYRHNFPNTTVLQKSIEALTQKSFDAMKIDIIHMSPPCQPFTRVGKQKDNQDKRTDSFFIVLDRISNMAKKPKYITVENVKGFETSKTHDSLINMLKKCGYTYKEWLLSPLEFGIPNSRLRYYLTAKLGDDPNFSAVDQKIQECIPESATPLLNRRVIRRFQNRRFIDNKHKRSSRDVNNSNHHDNDGGDGGEGGKGGGGVGGREDGGGGSGVRCGSGISCGSGIGVVGGDVVSKGDGNGKGAGGDAVVGGEDGVKNKVTKSHEALAQLNPANEAQCADHPLCLVAEPTLPSPAPLAAPAPAASAAPAPLAAPAPAQTSESPLNHDEEDDLGSMGRRINEACFVSVKSTTPYPELYKKYRLFCDSLHTYLDSANDDLHFNDYAVTNSEYRYLWAMDLVTSDVNHSCCFTKRYGHHVDGAGSIIQVNKFSTADLTCFRDLNSKDTNTEYIEMCDSLKLRRFSPREIANLMCFPQSFNFPTNFTTIQCYRALGNSLNVHMLSVLIKIMVTL